jgi:formylglycine-generating enzyme required for sulfatase activity
MTLDAQLQQQLIHFLMPYFEDEVRRRALVRLALSDCPIVLNAIDWDGSALEFTQQLVQELDLYGVCDQEDLALVTLLKGLLVQVGSNKQIKLRGFIREIRKTRSATVIRTNLDDDPPPARRLLGFALLSIFVISIGFGGWLWLRDQGLLAVWFTAPTPPLTPTNTALLSTATPIPTSLPPTPTATFTAMPTFTPSPLPMTGGAEFALQQALEQARTFTGGNADWLALYPQGFVWEFDGFPMVLVPQGCVSLGNDLRSSLGDRDGGQHCIKALWLDRTEITNQQYERCLRAGECEPPRNRRYFLDPALPQHPVVYVDWQQAQNYCRWRGTTLPTEVIWEYAARGSAAWYFPWGDTEEFNRVNACDRNCVYNPNATANDDGYGMTAPVGSYPQGRSWVGALDLAGNVKEWTTSLMYLYPYEVLRSEDPTRPTLSRVLRGGAWNTSLIYVRGASRERGFPSEWRDDIGFRCVRPVD